MPGLSVLSEECKMVQLRCEVHRARALIHLQLIKQAERWFVENGLAAKVCYSQCNVINPWVDANTLE